MKKWILPLLLSAILLLVSLPLRAEMELAQELQQVNTDDCMGFLQWNIKPPLDLPTSGLVEVPYPLSGENPRYPSHEIIMPSVGELVLEADLGTSFSRVTEGSAMRHEYSRFDPFNANKTLILLTDIFEGGFHIYRSEPPFDAASNWVMQLELEEPRWHPSDSDHILGLNEFRLLECDVETGETVVLKGFSTDPLLRHIIRAEDDLYRITMKEEGECSLDGRWWALALQGSQDDHRLRYLFTWDRELDAVTGIYKVSPEQKEIDWIGMSPKGGWVIIGSDSFNAPPLSGTVIANREFTEFHRINYDIGHSDVGLDSGGNEVIVMQNSYTDYIDMLPLDPSTRPILQSGSSYVGTNRTPLVRLYYANESPVGFDSGVHISCNAPGWALISTHIAPGTPERNWLDNSIVLVHLDPSAPRTFYLAKTHNITEDYWEETQGTISRDGLTVLWVANFGTDPGNNRTCLLRLDLN